MARIPDMRIERLKQEVSLERLAEARGVKLKRHGADLIGLCPFHDDRKPSLVISRRRICGTAWARARRAATVIDWVMQAEGVSFRHAVELLRDDHLPVAASSAQPVKQSTVRKLPAPIARDADDARAADAGGGLLPRDAEAVAGGAGVSGNARPEIPEMIDHFQLGFANRTLGLSTAGEEPQGRRGDARTVAGARHPARDRATSTSTARWSFRSSMRAATCSRCTGARSRRGCAKARRCICICRGRTAACGTKRRWPPRKKSFCASR